MPQELFFALGFLFHRDDYHSMQCCFSPSATTVVFACEKDQPVKLAFLGARAAQMSELFLAAAGIHYLKSKYMASYSDVRERDKFASENVLLYPLLPADKAGQILVVDNTY